MVIHHVMNGRVLASITWTPLPRRQVQAYGDIGVTHLSIALRWLGF